MSMWTSLEQLIASIPDGSLIATGGFMLGRAPMAAVFELVRQNKRNLHIMSLPNPLPAEILVAAGCLAKVEAAFIALTLDGKLRMMPTLKRAIEQGTIEWTEHDGYRVVQRLRAAGMGLPFLPAPDAELCDLSDSDPPPMVVDPFTGKKVAVEPAVLPDVAIIHAQAADAQGNLYIEDPTTDLLVLNAAKRVLVTAETKVDTLERITVPSFMVHAIAYAPRGALPSGCAGHYAHDEATLLDYLAAAEAGKAREWLDGNSVQARVA
jgi:glutaconate CoA-transferase subunit A